MFPLVPCEAHRVQVWLGQKTLFNISQKAKLTLGLKFLQEFCENGKKNIVAILNFPESR
jgi:hypothetical protein